MWFVIVLLSCLQFAQGYTAADLSKSMVEVKVTNVRSDKGKVLLSVFQSEKGFPSDPDFALLTLESEISEGQAFFSFEIEKGAYAISVLHDENGNEQLDLNMFGIPQEGIGVSNNVKGFFGPPPFKKAVFETQQDTVRHSIQMTYL